MSLVPRGTKKIVRMERNLPPGNIFDRMYLSRSDSEMLDMDNPIRDDQDQAGQGRCWDLSGFVMQIRCEEVKFFAPFVCVLS